MQADRVRISGASRTVRNEGERSIHVKIPANLRRMVSGYQARGTGEVPYENPCTIDEAITDILRRFFESEQGK
jgi:hypothetical protein